MSLQHQLCRKPRCTLTSMSTRKQVEDQQRQELLSGSRSAADYAMHRDADSQGMSYVDNSKRVLEEAFQTGTAVLQNMSGQRERLKVPIGCCTPGSSSCTGVLSRSCCRLPKPRPWTSSTVLVCRIRFCVSLSGARRWTNTLHTAAW